MSIDLGSENFDSFLKTIDILYVEDEDSVRELLEKRLAKHFGTIYSAPNGEVGLYKFETYRPRIVVTDIRMPIMNGIEMLKAIKEKSQDARAIVTTAHSDSEYMIQSIDIGIDKYIVKPVNVDTLVTAIKKIAVGFYNEDMSKEYQRQRAQEKIIESTKNVFEQISNSIPSPLALFKDGKSVFMNEKFLELFSTERITDLSNGKIDLDGAFDIDNESSVDVNKKVEIKLPNGRKKIFNPSKVFLSIDSENDSALYHLKDITSVEYQNIKLKNYTDILYDILRLKNSAQTKQTEPSNVEKKDLGELITAQELEALKRSHTYKTSAAEYTADMPMELLEELDELKELEFEIDELLDSAEREELRAVTEKLGAKFNSYAKAIGKLVDFEDLAIAVRNLGNYLGAIPDNEEINWSRLLSSIQNIRFDLSSWRQMIFVDKNAVDIHYLDSSLLSSCIQAQLGASKKNIEFQDVNELELF